MLVHTAAEAGGGIQLFLPPLSEVILSAIIVLLIALVLVKYALPKYNEIVEERAKTIEEGIEATKKAKREADVAEAKAEGAILAAQQEAQKIREAAHEEGKGIVADARNAAKSEADRIIENSHRQIEADRQAAKVSLQSDVGRLASELADKIVGEHLQDEELSARVIDRFLADMENQTATVSSSEGRHV